jgi:aminodeoxyfutalosine deaminase
VAASLLSLDERGVADLARAAIAAGFAPAAVKHAVQQEIDDYLSV